MFIRNLAYEASAGSGKTFMLVVRYLSLLFKGADPAKILALTFTNKAANEMQERIVQTLETLESRGELDAIAKVTEFSHKYLLQNRDRVLNEFLNSHTKIMTIDSFFTKILRKFSLYASLMPDFSTFSSQHEIKLFSRFLQEVSIAGKKETLLSLSLSSSKRLTDIFALLDSFYIKFIELKEIKFQKQDASRFEKAALKAMDELKKIVCSCEAASKTALKSVEAQNFEEIAAKKWLERETLNYRTFSKCYVPEMDDLLLKIKEAVKKQNRAKEQNFFFGLRELVALYIKSKRALYMEDSELSFSDVTYLVYEILHLIEDSEFLYFRLDAQIEHMLLDEFQDTSILQYEILKPLINEITSGEGIFSNGSFFFVGDVKQSIYRFRGGVSALFEAVREENATHVEKLLTNYRSQKEIVSFVNAIFEKRIKNYTPQLFRKEAAGGYVEIVQNNELLDEVFFRVQKLLELGTDINEIAVLCATNGDGEEVREKLCRQGIEVVTETTTKLINQKSVKALLEYLKYHYFGKEIYKENFFALIERESFEIAREDLGSKALFEVIKEAIERFALFSGDFNLIRFLDAVAGYGDIEALLFEYERMDISAAASELRGVRVLTVHKSKGLEYEHVIVMDRLKRAPASRDPFIYEYENISLKNIYLRIKGRDAVDTAYAKAIRIEKELEREDELNALYVAFTRAKESLTVIAKSKDSMFQELDLQPKRYGELKSLRSANKVVAKRSEKTEYEDLYYGTQSDILAMEKEQQEDIKAINFGLALHYMLEMLESFDVSSVKSAQETMRNRFGALLDDAQIEDIGQRVTMLLKSELFLSLTKGKCFREKAIRYKNNLRYIDLLVQNNTSKESLLNRWNVIDYKSARSYAHEHKKQVEYYVRAIEEITGEKAEGYICYLLEQSVEIEKI